MADMNRIELDGPPPLWDEALEGLMKEEYRKKGAGLCLTDIVHLAMTYAIRFDDIMNTLFELVLHGKWRYTGADGAPHEITREEINRLYVDHRLRIQDMQGYRGDWEPVRE